GQLRASTTAGRLACRSSGTLPPSSSRRSRARWTRRFCGLLTGRPALCYTIPPGKWTAQCAAWWRSLRVTPGRRPFWSVLLWRGDMSEIELQAMIDKAVARALESHTPTLVEKVADRVEQRFYANVGRHV